ncbi:MAG TPA: hypothetical protein VF941_00120 [Clostridia bacterium]
MKKNRIICFLITILTFFTLSVNSFAMYEKYPFNDSYFVKRFTNTDAGAHDIAVTDNSIIVSRGGVVEEFSASNPDTFIGSGKVSGIENIDYAGYNFGLIGSSNNTKRIYFNIMTSSTDYIPYPTDYNITNITAINGKINMEVGISGSLEPTLYIYISVPGTYYGSKVLMYKYYTHFRRLSFIKSYSYGYDESGDFANVNSSKLVGMAGLYVPYFTSKTEINSPIQPEKGLPSGYNCHGYQYPGNNEILCVWPSKLSYRNGYYYALIQSQTYADIVKIPEYRISF